MQLLRSFMRKECGATAVEYGIIVSVLSLAMIAGFGQASGALDKLFVYIGTTIESHSP